jgi:ribose transport system ATP-binding protein
MVEIAKALVREPRLIIMDEATSALTAKDVEQLYKVIRQLRDRGIAILYISHRMHEKRHPSEQPTVDGIAGSGGF